MAQAIPLEIPPGNAREELRRRLERAPDEHAEAILAGFELLQALHDQGLLDIGRGLLTVRDDILTTLARNASAPEATRAIRNLLFWRRVLGGIEPDCFQSIFEAIPEGFALATRRPEKPVTLPGLLRRLISQDTLRALAAGLDFLQSFGRRLPSAKTAARNTSAS